MIDRGIWASWYDLPAKGREAHLEWVHGTYIPAILKKLGVLWAAHYERAKIPPGGHLRHTDDASVPTGKDYILLFGAETAYAFSKGAEFFASQGTDKLRAGLDERDLTMLSMRVGERVCIFTEEARMDGPEAGRRKGKLDPSPCIQLGSFNAPGCEDELMAWYGDWRMPALSVLPGCVGIRKLVSTSGWAKHAVLYEFVSLEARNEHLPQLRSLYPEMGAWTDKCTPKLIHAPASPVVGQRIWPST